MPVYISPNVYANERDLSNFVENASPTVLGIVLTAQTGPVNEPTLVTNLVQAFETFGLPNSNCLGMFALAQYLSEGNQALVNRVVGPDANKPEGSAPGEAAAGYVDSTIQGPFAVVASTSAEELGSVAGDFVISADVKGFWTNTGPADLYGATLNLDTAPLTDGTLTLTIDGVGPTEVTTDFTAVYNGGDVDIDGPVAAGFLQGAINTAFPSNTVTVTWDAVNDVFVITSNAYGASGSVVVADGSTGTPILAAIGGAGTSTPGTDGNDVFEVDAEVLGTLIGAEQLQVAPASYTAAALAVALNAEMSGPMAAVIEFDEYPASSNQLRLKRVDTVNDVGTDHDIVIEPNAPVVGSMLATVGMTAGTVSGTDGNNRLRLAVDGGADQDIFLTAGAVRTTDQIVTELDAALTGASASKVVTSLGSYVRITSDTTGAASSVEIKDVDPPFGADDLLGFPTGTFSGSALAADVLTFAEKYFGDTQIVVRLSRGTAWTSTNKVYKVQIFQGPTAQLVGAYDNVRKLFTTAAQEAEAFEAVLEDDPYITVTDLGVLAELELPSPNYSLDITLLPTAGDPSGYVLTSGGAEVVGTVTPSLTGLEVFRDKETHDITILAAPGFSDDAVVLKLLEVAENRADCLALIDPPSDLSVQQVNDWANAEGTFTGSRQALNSSYGALYYPWVQIYDSVSGNNVWTPPSGHMAAIIARTDRTSESWYAPAGLNRGRVRPAIKLELNVTDGQRDFLQGNLNRVNTFVNLVGQGIYAWSQLTLHRESSQLSRIGVRRLMAFARKVITRAVRSMLFEPNDTASWARFESLVNPYLQDVQNRRGLQEFKVMMNSSTTTPALRDRNEARGIIFLRPTTSMEKIILDFVLTSQSASFSQLEDLLF